jgi:hypothetical protein
MHGICAGEVFPLKSRGLLVGKVFAHNVVHKKCAKAGCECCAHFAQVEKCLANQALRCVLRAMRTVLSTETVQKSFDNFNFLAALFLGNDIFSLRIKGMA